MNNKERYQKAASFIKPSADFTQKVMQEAGSMKKNENITKMNTLRKWRKLSVSIAAALVLVFGLTAVSYAADIGGFQRTVNSWLYGETTQVQVEQVGEYEYLLTYPDGSTRGTGGVAFDANGKERPLTPEEVLDEINNSVEIEENEEERIILYYHDHVEDITDMIDENGIVKIKFEDGALPTYFTIQWNGDGSYSVATGHFGYEKIDF